MIKKVLLGILLSPVIIAGWIGIVVAIGATWVLFKVGLLD